MDSRREFLRKAVLLSGAVGVSQFLPPSIQKAFAINPEPGSTYLDAEHIVFLMQENRSFDHTYGTLQGVRGFNDPRAIRLPNKNLVWLQSNAKGETYAPFRYDIKNTKITWMGSLPHGWDNQNDARNEGKYDGWLEAKKIDNKEYEHMPLTLGYYTREDLPFYYALADAFTVCDHNFCSSLTATTPNRLHFWTGTIREEQNEHSKACVQNEDSDYDKMHSWKTFPERLEENDISWKIYQNDLSTDSLLTDEQDFWLDNFGDNPIEFFSKYNVLLSERYINFLEKKSETLPGEIDALDKKSQAMSASDKDFKDVQNQLKDRKALLERVTKDKAIYTREKYDRLSAFEKNLHEKAFSSNVKDPHYHDLEPLKYKDGDVDREINIPKGDVLHQFREDVEKGSLPMISWIVPPTAFSDHPCSPWFGAWYLSEVMDILTKNPEVWKKTIFVLTYDENDGYFDHLPPFVAPNPYDASTGKTSAAIDTRVDFVTMEQEKAKKPPMDLKDLRQGSIGLGFRVPMVIASPWSRGGYVNSQVFDHTSSLQFLEKFLSHKTGKEIEETNISAWRRAVCGDLTSAFRPDKGGKINSPAALDRNLFIESIHKAQFKNPPADYKILSAEEIGAINTDVKNSPLMPGQEKGIRPANALPYEIYADGQLSGKDSFEIFFKAGKNIFGENAAGVPFMVYAIHKDDVKVRSYAVLPGDYFTDSWKIVDFENGNYHLEVHGPNGFFRSFKGNKNDGAVDVACSYQAKKKANIELTLQNKDTAARTIEITDHYTKTTQTKNLDPQIVSSLDFDLAKTYGWYDISLKVKDNDTFEKRYAGKVETGKESFTDPMMGRVI